jgi:hypothetical protein
MKRPPSRKGERGFTCYLSDTVILFAFGRQQSFQPEALKALFDPKTPTTPTLSKMPIITHLVTNEHE